MSSAITTQATSRFRKLRIAWSMAWVIVCLLVIALWVRSYYRRDVLTGMIWSCDCAVESADGNIAIMCYYVAPGFTGFPWRLESYGPKSRGYARRISTDLLLKDWAVFLVPAFLVMLPWVSLIKWRPKPRNAG